MRKKNYILTFFAISLDENSTNPIFFLEPVENDVDTTSPISLKNSSLEFHNHLIC